MKRGRLIRGAVAFGVAMVVAGASAHAATYDLQNANAVGGPARWDVTITDDPGRATELAAQLAEKRVLARAGGQLFLPLPPPGDVRGILENLIHCVPGLGRLECRAQGGTSFSAVGLMMGDGADRATIAGSMPNSPSGLNGGPGNDDLRGGEGWDVLVGGPGADLLSGGGGPQDTVVYSDHAVGVSVTIDGVANDGSAGEGDNVGPDVEDVTASSEDDVVVGSTADNNLSGRQGDDHLVGGPGDDFLDGGSGDDELIGGPGDDFLGGSAQDDVIDAADGERDRIRCDGGFDRVTADPQDVFFGGGIADCEDVTFV